MIVAAIIPAIHSGFTVPPLSLLAKSAPAAARSAHLPAERPCGYRRSQNWALVPNRCPRRNAVSPLIARLKGRVARAFRLLCYDLVVESQKRMLPTVVC